MRNELAKYTVDWVGVTGSAALALGCDCPLPAPFITMDETQTKVT